ncbi:MAG: parA [Acidimicrobiales bacterium]|nr:parA [Acidimicrobiales bacterium]
MKDGLVTSTPPPDDMVKRGRAIFDRLRSAKADDEAAEDADGTVDLSMLPPPPGSAEPAESIPSSPEDADHTPLASDALEHAAASTPISGPDPGGPGPGPGPDPILDAREPEPAFDRSEPASPATVPAVAAALPLDPPPTSGPAVVDETAADGNAAPKPPVRPPLPRIMAVANQKGGVGKTTTTVNLGACLAELGYRTLVVDLDPQGNASTGLGINIRSLQASMYDVILNDVPIEDCVEASSVRNLFVAPASLDLAGAEIELVPAFSREQRLKSALAEVRDDYDYVLIDCPPSLGLLTVNGMAAATEVLVPIQCEYYALEGLGQLLRNVTLVQKNLNPTLEVTTIVLVMYDARTKLSDQVVNEVREHFGDKVCRIVIPRTVRLSEAPSFGQPIIAFDPSSRGAIAYKELAKEVSGGASQRVG